MSAGPVPRQRQQRRRKPPETATQRLGRLLDMVPWLLKHPGVSVAEAAREFGISEEQVVDDLQLLFVCGTPGYGHTELIDAQWDEGRIFLDNAEDIAAPMRLTRDEAITLMAGLQALSATLVTSGIAERTLAKIRAAATLAGDVDPASRIALDLDDGRQHPAMARLREAYAAHRRVHLSYYVPTRDEATERDVDIMRIVNLDGHWYVEGWCHRANDVRLFRLDRIDSVTLLDADGTPPPQARPRSLDDVFVPSETDLTVVIEATRDAAWIADYYPSERVERAEGGSVRVTLKVADPAFVRRLVLRLAGQAWVVEPVELARAVADEAESALAAYE